MYNLSSKTTADIVVVSIVDVAVAVAVVAP